MTGKIFIFHNLYTELKLKDLSSYFKADFSLQLCGSTVEGGGHVLLSYRWVGEWVKGKWELGVFHNQSATPPSRSALQIMQLFVIWI